MQPHTPERSADPHTDMSPAPLVDRRALLRAGVVVAAGAWVTGCASSVASRPTSAGTASTVKTPPRVSSKPSWLGDWKANGAAQPTAGVAVRPRQAWASTGPIMSRANNNTGINRITVHHDGMTAFTTPSEHEAARRIENIRAAHVGQGWADIGYHYIIDPEGRVWEGRPVALQGAHVRNNNPNNLGIMCLGNYNLQTATAKTTASLASLIRAQIARFHLSTGRVYTHQEIVATACPGRSLQSEMNRLRAPGGPIGVMV